MMLDPKVQAAVAHALDSDDPDAVLVAADAIEEAGGESDGAAEGMEALRRAVAEYKSRGMSDVKAWRKRLADEEAARERAMAEHDLDEDVPESRAR